MESRESVLLAVRLPPPCSPSPAVISRFLLAAPISARLQDTAELPSTDLPELPRVIVLLLPQRAVVILELPSKFVPFMVLDVARVIAVFAAISAVLQVTLLDPFTDLLVPPMDIVLLAPHVVVVILAVPLKLVPFIVLAVCNCVAVAELPPMSRLAAVPVNPVPAPLKLDADTVPVLGLNLKLEFVNED